MSNAFPVDVKSNFPVRVCHADDSREQVIITASDDFPLYWGRDRRIKAGMLGHKILKGETFSITEATAKGEVYLIAQVGEEATAAVMEV